MRAIDLAAGARRLLVGAITVFITLSLGVGLVHAEQASSASTSTSGMQATMEKRLEEIPSGEEGVEKIMTNLDERLKLSDEQKNEIRPTVVQTVSQLETIRDRFKAGEITPMALGMQVQMATQKAAVQIDPILTEEQRVEYASMRQEQRREMMKAMQQARPAASAAAGAN